MVVADSIPSALRRKHSVSVLGFVFVVVLAVGASPVVVAEGVTLSRYKLTAQVGPDTAHFTPIAPAVLDEFCRDDDGCAISLKLETVEGLQASESRLYLSGISASWSSSAIINFVMVDGNGLTESGGEVDVNGARCVFWDLDEPDFFDSVEGFGISVGSNGQASATCVLVISD